MLHIQYQVGRSSSFSLWHDPWVNHKPLLHQFGNEIVSVMESHLYAKSSCDDLLMPSFVMHEILKILEFKLSGLNLVRNVESKYHQRDIDVLGSNELVEQILSGVGQNHVTIYVEVVDLGVFLQ
ncbi:hypothetical protein POM88_038023 [Heracleum sosnowskyi]|uniref:Uncharacterized protein n=1 Tax=Heracleum sosnowskyi TaxID=360622 RepID=A0AAD8HRL6_9APIA|nr:hypothetical protein POM88_038023 [Heracleum sosnowskyi]